MDKPAERKRRADERVSTTQIVAIIAERVQLPGEALRAAKDRVRQRLKYAETGGKLNQLGVPAKDARGRHHLGGTLGWASTKWPGRLSGLPKAHFESVEDGLGVGGEAGSDLIPAELGACQSALRKALDEIRHLKDDLAHERAAVEHLTPVAQKFRALAEKNRASAKLPRSRRA